MTQPFPSSPRRARRRARVAGDPARPPAPTDRGRRERRPDRRPPPPPRRGPLGDPRVAAGLVVVGLAVVVAVVLLLGKGASSAAPSSSLAGIGENCPTSQPAALAAGETRTVTISTAKGDIVMKIHADLSPIATGNFVALAACGFYDGLVFHRAATMQDGTPFVIQGGDPSGDGSGGPGYSIRDEPVTSTYKRGTVAMARSSAPNSQGSQFFIVLDDKAGDVLSQANDYAILGEVTSGMNVADAIYQAAGGDELPTDPVAMTSVTVANP